MMGFSAAKLGMVMFMLMLVRRPRSGHWLSRTCMTLRFIRLRSSGKRFMACFEKNYSVIVVHWWIMPTRNYPHIILTISY